MNSQKSASKASTASVQEEVEKPVKTHPVTVLEEIERGRVINQERICKKEVITKFKIVPMYEKKAPAVGTQCKKKKKRKAKKNTFSFYKVVYPKSPGKPRSRTCNHYDNTVIDRQILGKAEHIKILATPRAAPPRKFPRFVKVHIPPCTNRLNSIAQPKKTHLVLTWKQKVATITAPEVENYNKMLDRYAFVRPIDVVKYMKQQQKDDKYHRSYEKRRIRKFKKMAQRQKIRDTKRVMEHLFQKVKPFLLKDQRFGLMEELAERSKYITKLLCDSTGIPLPCRASQNVFDRFILNLSDKFAIWMTHLLNAAKFEADEELKKPRNACEIQKQPDEESLMYPIEDYIRWIPEDEEVTESRSGKTTGSAK